MKTSRLILPLIGVALAVTAVQAAEMKPECCESGCVAKDKTVQQATTTKKQKKVAVTGSRIPVAPVVADDRYPKTAKPVVVFTRTDIDRSGARTLGQFLGNRVTSVGR